jgi:hypothetical protein
MEKLAIIALGGTGQTVLDFFLRSHLLRVGPLEDSGLTPFVKVIVVDQETSKGGDRRPSWEILQEFLKDTSAQERFEFHRFSMSVPNTTIAGGINSSEKSVPMKPEMAYASKKLRDARLDDGLFATPAALGFAWQFYGAELIAKLHAVLGDVTGAVVVASTFGGAGTGFTPAVLELLRSLKVRFISVVALGRYLTHREAEASADLVERYRQNHREYLRNLEAFNSGKPKLFQTKVLTATNEAIWDVDADKKFPPDESPVWTAAWWVGELLREYEQPKATGDMPEDAESVEYLRERLKERSQKAKNAVRYLVERDFLPTISRDPLARAYVGRFLRDGLLEFWKKWMDRVEGEPYDRFIPKVSQAMSTTFRQVDSALVSNQPPAIDFRALREALASAEFPEGRLHPILGVARPRADDVLRAAGAELLYRLMRRGANK